MNGSQFATCATPSGPRSRLAATQQPPGDWLSRFHAGEPEILEECYKQHYKAMERATAALLNGADRQTTIHEVFCRLLESARMRRQFKGGALGAWLATIARNAAIDHLRRRSREQPLARVPSAVIATTRDRDNLRQLEAQLVMTRFCERVLPHKWRAVFITRFVERLTQREAARRLGLRRTTLAYQEERIRASLRLHLQDWLEG